MEGVRQVTVIFCGAAVMAAALRLLCGNRLEKSGRYIIALIMLSAIITSVAGARINFSLPDIEASAPADAAVSLSEYQAERLVDALLKENNVTYGKIMAIATKSEGGGIIISEIRIEGAGEKDKILSVIRSAGIECAVVFS